MDFVQVRIVFEHANEGGCGGGFRPLPLYFWFDTSLVWLVNPEIYAVDESLLYFSRTTALLIALTARFLSYAGCSSRLTSDVRPFVYLVPPERENE